MVASKYVLSRELQPDGVDDGTEEQCADDRSSAILPITTNIKFE